MTAWVSLLGAILAVVTAVTRYFAKQERDDGVRAQVILEALETANAAIRKANDARNAQAERDRRNPDGMRDDNDPHRRD